MSSYPPPPSKRVIKIGTVVGRIIQYAGSRYRWEILFFALAFALTGLEHKQNIGNSSSDGERCFHQTIMI